MGDEARTDAELVERARTDPSAFALLYRRYAEAVYRYCHRRLGSREAAEDATSRVFVQALAALPRFRVGSGSFRAWLFTIAHHAVVDEARRRPTAAIEVASALADPAPAPDERVAGAELAQSVRGLLVHLGPEQRRVIELRLAGLTAAEIAGVLGRSRDAVDMAQYRALVKLRQLLKESLMREEVRRG